jgi:hypothetical protein
MFFKEVKDMVDLNWIGLAAGIGFGIMGLAAYLKTNLEGRQRERENKKLIKEFIETIKKGQLIKFEEVVPIQKKMIQNAKRNIWIFSINSLGLFHEHLEDFISLIKRGGNLKILLLDPESSSFKEREKKEEKINGKISGRLRAEYMASAAYCKDILNFSKGDGAVELRLHKENLKEALLIIDANTDNLSLHINTYPTEEHTRGYVGKHRIIHKENPDLIEPFIQNFERLWNCAKKVDLQ